MEKIKAALHIHDKTAVPADGAVGNMQNPGSSEAGPTSEELWGAGNAGTKHHHSHKGDTIAAAAAEPSKTIHQDYSRLGQAIPRDDDPFSAALQAQQQLPPPSSVRGDENAIVAAELSQGQALPQEKKTLSPIDDPEVVKHIDPFRNEPEPSAETGPGTSFTRPETTLSTATPAATPHAPAGHGEAELVPEGHTAFYDKATGKEGHELGK